MCCGRNFIGRYKLLSGVIVTETKRSLQFSETGGEYLLPAARDLEPPVVTQCSNSHNMQKLVRRDYFRGKSQSYTQGDYGASGRQDPEMA